METTLSRGTMSHCVVAETVTIFSCMKVKNVCQKSQCVLLDRTCNLLRENAKKGAIVCSVTLGVEKQCIYQLFEKVVGLCVEICASLLGKGDMQISLVDKLNNHVF